MNDLAAPCPLCNEPTSDLVTDRLRNGTGRVYQCLRCDHEFLMLDIPRDLGRYYGETYRQEYSHVAEGSATSAEEIFQTYYNYQDDRLKVLKDHIFSDTRLLEIGASAGQFLAHIKDRVALINAVELDKTCCSFLEATLGVETDSRPLCDSRFFRNKYDVVCSFHVMEHVDSPIDFLRDIRGVLAPGGTAFVEVPNRKDALLSIWGVEAYRDFYYRDVHLQYFGEYSARLAAKEAGFKSDECSVLFVQDYNLLNHLNWINNNAPQATCEPGLSPIRLVGTDPTMEKWLSSRLVELNDQYRDRLVKSGTTSNLMLVLSSSSES
ncbi:MAG: class I SAM-dependent methyltransferase [Acidimicrobiales bacterium]|nr:class I SAM-dependent methyltransferase [Acidimicrobiales bacterium]